MTVCDNVSIRILELLFSINIVLNGTGWKVQLLQFCCSYPVTEETKKLRSGVQLTVSIRLTSVNFTSKLADKTSLEYKDLTVKVIKVVLTH